MDQALDTEEIVLSAEDQAAADAAADEAFAASFGETNAADSPKGQLTAEEQAADDSVTHANAPAPAPAPAPASSPAAAPTPSPQSAAAAPAAAAPAAEEDPFAGLPSKVRDMLAEVPSLRHALNSDRGRMTALQRKLDAQEAELNRLRTAAPAAAPAAPTAAPVAPKYELLRGEYPEAADAIQEMEQRFEQRLAALNPPVQQTQAAAPVQQTTQTTVDDEETEDEKALRDVHPDWMQKAGSTDFALWLETQPQEFAAKVRSSSKAVVLADALSRFKAHESVVTTRLQQQAAERERTAREAAALQTSRSSRVAASAAPAMRGGARPPTGLPATEDPDAAFEAGFTSP